MTLDDVLRALKNADAAGDVESAKKLANIAAQMSNPLAAAEARIPIDYTLGEAAKKGFQRGTKQLGSALFDVLPAMGASALGFNEYAKKQMEEAAETEREIAEKYPAQFKSYTEVGSPFQALQYAAETIGEVGPSVLGAVVPGGVAGTLGRTLATRGAMAAAESVGPLSLAGREAAELAAKKAGETAGRKAMYGGVYLGSYAQNAPEIFQNIYQETGEFEPLVSGLTGGLSAILDSIVPGRVMDRLGSYGRLKAAEAMAKESGAAPSVWKAIGKEASKSAVSEGLTESAQEAISAAAEQVAGSAKDFLGPENIQRYKEAFVKGAIGGAGFGVVGGVGRGLAERGEFQAKQEREQLAKEEAEQQKQLAGEVAASEAEIKAITEAGKQPQMELPGMELGQEYGPASTLVPPPVEPTTETTAKEPEQIPLLGPQGGVTKIAQKNVLRKITPTELEKIRGELGIAPTANLFKPEKSALLNLDLLNPEGAAEAKQILQAYAEGRSPRIQNSVAKWIATNLDPVITRGAPSATGTDIQAGGEGVGVPDQGVGGAAAAPVVPVERGGVDVAGGDVSQPAGGETAQPGALETTTPVETQAAPTQAAPTQAAPTQAAPTQAAPTQAAPTQAAPTQAAPASQFPNIKDIPGVLVGTTYIKPKPIAEGKPLFRETNSQGLDELLRGDREPTYQPLYVSENPDTALGQGENRGIYVTFRPDSLSGTINQKPGTEFAGLEHLVDIVAPRAIHSIVIPKAEIKKSGLKLSWLAKVNLRENFNETLLPDGSVRFDRKGIAPAAQVLGPVEKATPAPKRAAPKAPGAVSKQLVPPSVSPVPTIYKPNGDPSDSEASFVHSGLRGKNAIQAAKWLAKNSPNWDYRLIADKVAKTIETLEKRGVKFSFNIRSKGSRGAPPEIKDRGTRGIAFIYFPKGGVSSVDVWLNGADVTDQVGTSFEVALHELIHAATSATLILETRRPSADMDPRLKTAIKQLEAVYNHARSKLILSFSPDARNNIPNLTEAQKNLITHSNALRNIREFLAWGITNRDFQKMLELVEYKKTGRSLWSAFVESIRTFLGLPAKADTALAELLRVSEVILENPTKQVAETFSDAARSTGITITEGFNEQSIRIPNIGEKLVGPNGAVDKILQKIPSVMTPERRTEMWRMLEKLALPARALVYKALNASQLGEVASRYFGNDSVRFTTVLNEIGGYRQKIEERLEPLNRQFVAHREKYPDRHAALHALMNDATIADVAPYSDAETAKKYKNTAKETTYEALKKRFDALNPEEQQLYRSAFNTFKSLRTEFQNALKGNISELVKDEGTALSIYNKIMNELSQVMIDHYFPLYRRGDFRLSYTLNGEAAVQRFESQAERLAAQRALEAQGATNIEATSQLNQFDSRNIPDGTMLSAVMKVVKDAGGGKEDLDKIVQLVVSAFPETSILKQQQRRMGIPGYINDNAALVFDTTTSNNAQQIATIKYREELKTLLNNMRVKQSELSGDASEDAKTLYNDLNNRFDFAMNPDIAGWAQIASSTAFYWNLAANTSSALVQLATVPTVVFPSLGGRYGSNRAWSALNAARKLYQSSGFTRQIEGLDGRVTNEKSMLSIENLVNQGKAEKYAALINAMKDNELLTGSTAHNAIRAENRTDSGYGAVNKLQRLGALYSSFLMHHTERMSREITAVATYDLEMERLKKSKPNMPEAERQVAAIQEAMRVVQRTHGAVTSITGTAIGQSSLGKMFMVFKNYAFAQYYNLFSTIFRAFPVKDASPEVLEDIRAARRQLIGMYGMVSMVAGVKGVPLYWVAELAYNAFREDDEDDFDTLMRKYLGELAFKGPINYITNLSIADRVGWTDLIWRENKNDRAGASAITQQIEALLGAPMSIAKNFEKGFGLISEGHWYRGVETMLPAAIKNPMKAMRYAAEGANTLRGDPVMADVNIGNAAMQVLGFAPADLMTQYEQNAYILEKQKAIRGSEQRLLQRYYIAMKNGDMDTANEAVDKLYELGEKYPELKIGPALLNKSVRERDRFSSKLYHGMRIDEKLRARLLGAAEIAYE